MNRNKRISKPRKINPTYFVFCEGKTERSYIEYLRAKYRLPIHIDFQIAKSITEKHISSYKKNKANHPKDKTYLVYDLDVPEMLGKLQKIKSAIILSSNPCFELWYLLHFQKQEAKISSEECVQKLKKHFSKYAKDSFDREFKNKIENGHVKAIARASKLETHENPSSQLYIFIKELEGFKNQNKFK